MKTVVYIDVLFAVNLIINYFILLAVSKIMHRKDKRIRLFTGAVIGAVYALFILFPSFGFLYVSFIKFLFSVLIVMVAFKFDSFKNLLKLVLLFYIISLLFGGVIFAAYMFVSPPGVFVRNGVVYFNISPLLLILSSAACYIVINLVSRVIHRSKTMGTLYKTEIVSGNCSIRINALMDTGNCLDDVISGMPIIIAEYRKVERLIPDELKSSFKNGFVDNTEIFSGSQWAGKFRMIPYGSVGNMGGLLPAFKPDKLIISNQESKTDISDVLVAVTSKKLSDDGQFEALLNPHIFR